MVGLHHQLNGHEFEQAPGDGQGQGSLVCCSSRLQRVVHDWAAEQQQLGLPLPHSIGIDSSYHQVRASWTSSVSNISFHYLTHSLQPPRCDRYCYRKLKFGEVKWFP